MSSDEREDLWIESADGSLDEDSKQDLAKLAARSRPDLEGIEIHGRLRKALKTAGQVTIPRDPAYWEQMHAKIMNSVQQTSIHSRWRMRGSVTRMVAFLAAVAVLVVTFQIMRGLLRPTPQVPMAVLDPILEISQEDPSVIAGEILSHENLDDIVLEAAVRKMERLSERDFEKTLSGLKSL